MGLVTVALLTLAPLALRPVRLACLIHAANVHSEPGSNPSKVGVNAGADAPRPRLPLPVGNEDADCGRTGSRCVSNASAAGSRDRLRRDVETNASSRRRTTRRRLPSRVHDFRSTTDRIVKEAALWDDVFGRGDLSPRGLITPAVHRLVVVSRAARVILNRQSTVVNRVVELVALLEPLEFP